MRYSVIIPIYNAESTLDRCLESIEHQMRDDTEAILVNDGSTDSSGDICKKYLIRNRQFHYYTQNNAGVAAARNRGLDNAKGEFIVFLDSDDYLRDGSFTAIDSIINEYSFDYIVSSIVYTDGKNERISLEQPFEAKSVDKLIPKISDLICRKKINGPVAKIYKKSIIDKYSIRFPVGCNISEDRAFNISYALHISSIKVTDYYYYYAGISMKNSLSRTIRSVSDLDHNFDLEERAIEKAFADSDLEDKHIRAIRAANNFCECRQVYSRAKRMKLRGATKQEILRGINMDCKRVNAQKLKYPKTSYCMKIYLPVKFRMYWLIYEVSNKLAEKQM